MNARGTKIKASVEALKARIQKVLDEETAPVREGTGRVREEARCEKSQKQLAAVTAEELKERTKEDGGYHASHYPLPLPPGRPAQVDRNHQRLLNMLELTSDDVIVLSLDSEFRAYL